MFEFGFELLDAVGELLETVTDCFERGVVGTRLISSDACGRRSVGHWKESPADSETIGPVSWLAADTNAWMGGEAPLARGGPLGRQRAPMLLEGPHIVRVDYS